MKYTWKEKQGQYQSGESLYINRICVGTYEWNAFLPKTEADEIKAAKRYEGRVLLPQSRNTLYGSSPKDIKAKIKKAVDIWFSEINKEAKQ